MVCDGLRVLSRRSRLFHTCECRCYGWLPSPCRQRNMIRTKRGVHEGSEAERKQPKLKRPQAHDAVALEIRFETALRHQRNLIAARHYMW
ncbi:hypothetical protein LSTR_LSTR005155 [Laodelphax striatellus]|uniref:Uncharacterized protein n=1 Tax=Laodelphax striatellus TaxID=195883 RepID=A0A482WZH0_LAOST|nr:hypothetical protein LSTR_LSTR005155 [Laodelphax striatellus]